MKIPRVLPATDHGTEIGLLAVIAVGVLVLMGIGHRYSIPDKPFDPSAYLVVLTLIVGAVKERWTQRSVDRMGQQLSESQPRDETVTAKSAPKTAIEGAEQTADAASDEAAKIAGKGKP